MRELDVRHMSAREASLSAGLSHAAIHRFLSGTRPTPESMQKLADFFDVPVDYIRELTGEKRPSPEHMRLAAQLAELLQGATEDEQAMLLDLARSLRRRHQGHRLGQLDSNQSPQSGAEANAENHQ